MLIITSVHIDALHKKVFKNPLKLHRNPPRIQPFATAVINNIGMEVNANDKSATAKLNIK